MPHFDKKLSVIVALFPKLKLNRTLRSGNSGVQICCTVKYRLYSASLTFLEFQRGRFKQLPIREGKKYRNRGETIKWWYSLEMGPGSYSKKYA